MNYGFKKSGKNSSFDLYELSKLYFKFIFLTTVLVFGWIFQLYAADFQMFSDVKLIKNSSNDGDSFLVDANGKSFRIRLYFVDCPENSASSKSGARRVREQTRYFGLSHAARTIYFGNEAKIFVKGILAKPFLVYTSFASALGRSAKGRVYGIIITADGNDLGSLLVKNGFARTYGIGRKTPDGIPRDEMIERLRDLEASAMLKRIGIWAESNPDHIAKFRAKQRSEDQELKDLQNRVKTTKISKDLLNINTASKEELMFINGIGPVLAGKIINSRPYKTVDSLIKVKGIGAKKLEKIRPYIFTGKK